MTDAEAAIVLYRTLINVLLFVVVAAALVLTLIHLVALHGRRLLPERAARLVGWFVFGLAVGLSTQLMSDAILGWVFAGLAVAWVLIWARGEGRLGDAGVALIGGALSWLVGAGLIPVLEPRLPIVVGALLAIGIGVVLIVAAPRWMPRTDRALTPVQRAMLLPNAIERGQAMGPVSAPMVLGVLAGTTAAVASLVLGSTLEPILRHAISGAAFIGVGLVTWRAATPRRVSDAYGVLGWLVETERRMWAERVGRPLPRTARGARALLDWLPDGDIARPLRVEALATFGRTGEARDELAKLPVRTPEERAVEAELAEYVDWYEAKPAGSAIDRLANELPSIDDPGTRVRLTASLALARARRAAVGRDPAAIDHLAAVRPLIGQRGWRIAGPGTMGLVIGFVLIGVVGFWLYPTLAYLPGGVR